MRRTPYRMARGLSLADCAPCEAGKSALGRAGLRNKGMAMLILGLGLLGLAFGAWRARQRGGRGADLAHYAAVHGFAFALLGLFLTLLLLRLG